MDIVKSAAIIAVSILALSACSQPKGQTESAEGYVIQTLKDAASRGSFLYGHQDDLSYGHFWSHPTDVLNDPIDRSDVKSVCGDYPAIVGFDLGGIELGDNKNLDSVDFTYMRRAAMEHIARGGIVTFSWHPRNPLTGGDAWDISSDQVVASVTGSGELSAKFEEWLDNAAEFLASIKNPDGSQAQVIFRPWHEHMGSWFWWGGKLCTKDEYVALWTKTYDNLVNKHGLSDIIWAYSPSSDVDKQGYMERYPGDDMVDLFGFDLYQYGPMEFFVKQTQNFLSFASELAVEHGKPLIMSETGSEGIQNPSWWTEGLLKAVEGYPVCYVLTWRNACDKPTHFYGPWPGADCEKDFQAFYEDGRTLFLGDISK